MDRNGMNQDAFNVMADFFPSCWFRDLVIDGSIRAILGNFFFFSYPCSYFYMYQLMGHLVGLKSR